MSTPTLVAWLPLALGAYLLGSVPFGLLIGKARGIDVREHGSRNIGATNVGRVLGRSWGFLCFGLDFLKGAVPVLVSGWWMGLLGEPEPHPLAASCWLAVGAAALLGHVFPVYLRFKGGKGVATGFGVMLAMHPGVSGSAAVALGVWLGVLALTRMVSVSSCAAALSLPVSVVVLRALGWPAPLSGVQGWSSAAPYLVVTVLLAVLVVWKHRANLARVRAGTEPRIGHKPLPPSRG